MENEEGSARDGGREMVERTTLFSYQTIFFWVFDYIE